MMKQYRGIKSQVPDDVILFFRLGDFYEMFFDDAVRASEILDISLTKRHDVPMCGIPFHASEGYLSRLVKAGCKVAVCDQTQDPKEAKGIVEREIVRVVTPGTVLEENVLDSDKNNYLAGVCWDKKGYGLAMLDLSTGSFWIESCSDAEAVVDHLVRFQPAECVFPEELEQDEAFSGLLSDSVSTLMTGHDDWTFEYDSAHDLLCRHFGISSLEGFGCEGLLSPVGAAGGVFHYVSRQLKRQVKHISKLRLQNASDFMVLDEATLNNLELVVSRSALAGGPDSSLMKLLNSTNTAMGGRLLREWLVRPLIDRRKVEARHHAVQAMLDDRNLHRDLRDKLSKVRDLERMSARLSAGSGNARDVRAVASSLEQLAEVKALLSKHPISSLARLGDLISPLPDLVDTIDSAIVDEPPAKLTDGGIIREGYHDELDELRVLATQGKQWLADYQATEQERSGIKTLKVKYNKVFGYYIEISKGQLANVPVEYVRKQTLVNAERFITPELKEYENKILGSQERSLSLESSLFQEVRQQVVDRTAIIQETAAAVAELDILASFGERAMALNLSRPIMDDSTKLIIKDGRHPVVESLSDGQRFVPNDSLLDTLENQLIIITGPNMAGKSTYIRQVAVVVIMAQAGCFVPAAEAQIGMVDRVFTRVGASDDLARGRSTFMVEMQETANILNNASAKSLIVLDEIGRGTSTFDGISIAWAVAEHLHNNPDVKARTLFATHYHELTDLSKTMPGVKNYSVLVKEQKGRIAFLRKIVAGAADKSYGIHVAELAGLPGPVVERAREILSNLEEGELTDAGQPKLASKRPKKAGGKDEQQLSFFDG